ncbi:DNA cytosine methyltransferase [Pseudoalteromonas nigrifaciens]|uniref:DNA cytosine methyltransferase n=1 Tax=Pseudoalteromonas nigrifaciens TaxID=28109 RepID=UPI003FD29522
MPSLINRNLTEHRGAPRIYLDGALLNELGVDLDNPFYDRIWESDRLILRLNSAGKYKVSSKKKSGILSMVFDINTSKLSSIFSANSKLRIVIKKGYIVVTAHASEDAIEARERSFIQAIKDGLLSTASIFHGGGLLDYAMHSGFEKTKISSTTSFAIEIDSRYLNSSIKNNPHLFNSKTLFINSDVADVHTNKMRQVNALYAGIPCQGASLSGISKNKLEFAEQHTSAGACFFSFLNIVKASNPALVVMENVKAYMKTASFAVIKSVLGGLGYDLHTDVYDGSEFGATEKRERMVCIAISKGLNVGNMLSDIVEQIHACKTPSTPLAEIIEHLPADHPAWKEVDYLKRKEVRDREAGKGFRMKILDATATTCTTLGYGYAKARSTEPRLAHPTIKKLSRLFTKVEHALIKKAPPSIVDGLSETVGHQILGNGVIVSLFEAIAYSIGKVASKFFPKVSLAA